MRAAMTRRNIVNANEAIDEADSPVDGLEDGSLQITPQTTGNVKGKHKLLNFVKKFPNRFCFV